MTYWLLNAIFLAAVTVVAIATIVSRRAAPSTARARPRWAAVGLAGIALLLLTAVFDNLMIAAGLVAYAPEHISGVFIGVAPIEDFAYALAAAVGLPCLWALLPGRPAVRSSRQHSRRPNTPAEGDRG